jgi:hypothetical protein
MFLFNFNRLYTFTRFELRRPRTSMIRLERGGAWGSPAGLEDAIDHGHIAWSTQLDFAKMVLNPPPGFHRVGTEPGRSASFLDALVRPAEAGLSLANNSWTGKAEGFDVTLKLTPANGDLNIHPSAPGRGARQLQRISTAG